MSKTVLGDVREVKLAIELITLGARLQFLETEVGLSRERLIKLYKELKGVSPPKGLLPFSTDWYQTWLNNIHSSMFYNIYRFMIDQACEEKLPALMKAYRIYLEQVEAADGEAVLDFTRAAMLVKFFDSGMLELAPCTRCAGLFVGHAHDARKGYVCVLCRPPSRAGKGKGKDRPRRWSLRSLARFSRSTLRRAPSADHPSRSFRKMRTPSCSSAIGTLIGGLLCLRSVFVQATPMRIPSDSRRSETDQ